LYDWNVKSYNISEARDNFAAILKEVEAGESIVLTRYGKAIARIQPVEKPRPMPGFMARAGFSARMAPDFVETPPGFEEYLSPR
jgi:prevent-host-death family protein